MSTFSGKVHVTKLAAAQRQLRAAIRMVFAREDELAVHTVASAAYRILADLKSERGRDEVGDYYLTTIFYCVRDYRRGTLPSYLANDPDTVKWIREMAERLPIDGDTKFEDVIASVSPDVAKSFWQKRNKVSNFLKHANRDPKTHIALNEVDNLTLLMQSLGSYCDLVNDDLGAEGLVFWLYFNVASRRKEGLPGRFLDVAEHLEGLSPAERLSFCSAFVGELNARNSKAFD